ncbi:MAG TPA: response regulator [Usitatibacter sp.]|nr:response regulator [Usitatibacter sp.]
MSEVRRIGRYEIGTLIGKSPSAAVYRGMDGEKPVALKLVNRDAVPAERLEGVREATSQLARIRHPAIVGVVELMENEKTLCIVSEMAGGESLAAILKSGERPELRRVWEIARQLLEALEAANARGVFHGGIKPSNVFIDQKGQVCLTDFGLAGLVADSGAPEFMAPEQFSGGAVDARTDVYQAGALVYLLITGKPPFSGTRQEVSHRVREERPADPSSLAKKVAWQLDWVVQRALSKDPSDRMGGAREFMDGLRLALQESIGSPIPVPKSPAVVELAPEPPKAAPVARAPKPIAVAALAQKAKIIAAKPAAAPQPQPPPPPPKPRVLFVDDDARVLNALRALFREPFDVVTAESGAAALEIIKTDPVQIVVSDQRMPGMLGVELLREVRKASPRTVRILLTGYSDLAAMVGSINEGEVFRFVKKPWDNDEIQEVMKEAAAVVGKLGPPPAAKPPPASAAGSLLVIDTDALLAQGLRRLLAGEGVVHEASTPADAAKILQSHDVAAVVADLRVGAGGLVSLFKLLKAKRPDTLSILLSDQPDSEVVVELINQAHVHRFLAKPLDARQLHAEALDALKRYRSRLAEGVAPLSHGLVPNPA